MRSNAARGGRFPDQRPVTFSAQYATVVGPMIACGEVAAGLGALIGLFTRAAAALGGLLALSFFLTVSWHSSPYYFGSDIVFFFAGRRR